MSRLYIIRHAIAEDREDFAKKTGRPDEERPLTEKGAEKMKKIAQRLAEAAPGIDTFLQSPLVRSQQTVDILVAAYKTPPRVLTSAALKPGSSFDMLIQNLNAAESENLAMVGHETHLSEFTSYLLAGKKEAPFLQFKKGGAACLEFEGRIAAGRVRLLWFAPPKLLLD